MKNFELFWGSADDQNSMEGGSYSTLLEAVEGANAWLEELMEVCADKAEAKEILAGNFTVIDTEDGEKVRTFPANDALGEWQTQQIAAGVYGA
jgi:hypothetical protein